MDTLSLPSARYNLRWLGAINVIESNVPSNTLFSVKAEY